MTPDVRVLAQISSLSIYSHLTCPPNEDMQFSEEVCEACATPSAKQLKVVEATLTIVDSWTLTVAVEATQIS